MLRLTTIVYTIFFLLFSYFINFPTHLKAEDINVTIGEDHIIRTITSFTTRLSNSFPKTTPKILSADVHGTTGVTHVTLEPGTQIQEAIANATMNLDFLVVAGSTGNTTQEAEMSITFEYGLYAETAISTAPLNRQMSGIHINWYVDNSFKL